MLEIKVILKPCDDIRKMLEKIGFLVTKETEDLIYIKIPKGWKKREVTTGSTMGIFDEFNRLRITTSCLIRENPGMVNLTILPRFSIIGPSGNMKNNEIEGFVLDRKFPDGNPRRFIFKKKWELGESEDFSNRGTIPDLLMTSVKKSLEKKYPNFRDPTAYWN